MTSRRCLAGQRFLALRMKVLTLSVNTNPHQKPLSKPTRSTESSKSDDRLPLLLRLPSRIPLHGGIQERDVRRLLSLSKDGGLAGRLLTAAAAPDNTI